MNGTSGIGGDAVEGAPRQGEGDANESSPDTDPPSALGSTADVHGRATERELVASAAVWGGDLETTVNLTGEAPPLPARDDDLTVNVRGPLDIPVRDDDATVNIAGDLHFPYVRDDVSHRESGDAAAAEAPDDGSPRERDTVHDTQVPAAPTGDVARAHLKGLVEALVFAADKPLSTREVAKAARAEKVDALSVLEELRVEYQSRGLQLEEVAGGWAFRTNPVFGPFVRELTGQKPVKLTRAQIETMAIVAYRQPVTRPEIDEIRGVDAGPVLKVLLERDLVRILGKKEEPGRPLLYGTTPHFLEFFGLRSLKDLPSLKEFTELNDESRQVVQRELGEARPTDAPPTDAPDSPAETDKAANDEAVEGGAVVEEPVEGEFVAGQPVEGESSEGETPRRDTEFPSAFQGDEDPPAEDPPADEGPTAGSDGDGAADENEAESDDGPESDPSQGSV